VIFNFFVKIIHFQNEINVIMYISEFFLSNFESFHLDKILIRYEFSKFIFFVMFKIKYLINKM